MTEPRRVPGRTDRPPRRTLLGRRPKLFVDQLLEDGLLYRGAHEKPMPYATLLAAGYFRIRVLEEDGLSFEQTLVTRNYSRLRRSQASRFRSRGREGRRALRLLTLRCSPRLLDIFAVAVVFVFALGMIVLFWRNGGVVFFAVVARPQGDAR